MKRKVGLRTTKIIAKNFALNNSATESIKLIGLWSIQFCNVNEVNSFCCSKKNKFTQK